MQTLQGFLRTWTPLKDQARNVWRLNSQISQDGTFVHYTFFVLNIPLFTFSYRIFFFDICLFWHTLTARDDTRDRDAISSRQNDVTWCEFFFCCFCCFVVVVFFFRENKSSSSSLARFCSRKHKKIYCSHRLRAREKNWDRLLGKSGVSDKFFNEHHYISCVNLSCYVT